MEWQPIETLSYEDAKAISEAVDPHGLDDVGPSLVQDIWAASIAHLRAKGLVQQ